MITSVMSIGFIGLGVMGEPMCRNLASRSEAAVRGFDPDPAPLRRLAEHGVVGATSVRNVAEHASTIFLSLPSGEVVRQVCEGPEGLLDVIRAGQMVVDLSTSPVDITRELAARFAERGADFVDAPVARTRAAAEAGTLAIMVGAGAEEFARIKPLLATFASDIIHCGPVGCGQVVKILNNMVLFETVVALAEAKAIGERSGVDPALLFDALSKGSADSFALRSHGMKSMLPGLFPERAFSVVYARKDLAYALRLAEQTGIDASGATNVDRWFGKAIDSGLGGQYHPVVSRLIAA
ncbi:MAG: NAD(P)-dependent oxidoreductase [Burkholderiales bacterium]|nr:NAD(P)-dependent oxidoreductase [Burkholderiales bacterium]